MSSLREEMKIIPRTAWAIAVCMVVGIELFLVMVAIPRDEGMKAWSIATQVMFGVIMPLIMFTYVLVVGYVNGDARRRGMRHVLWTLLAIFIPNAIGIVLYFILRDRLLVGCPQCGTRASSGFLFCPGCGAALAPTCQGCGGAVEPGWSHCARCGARLRAA